MQKILFKLGKNIKVFFILILVMFFLLSCDKSQNKFQGNIETRMAYISVPYQGVLKQLFIKKGDPVTPQQPLFVLEEQPEGASYLQAKADLENAVAQQQEATANLNHEKLLLSRRQYLVEKKAMDQETLDSASIKYKDAVAKLAAAEAKVSSAKANLEQAAWAKSQKAITAEKAGVVFDTYYIPTELVPPNRPVLSLIYPDQIRAIFYIPEPQLSTVKIGQQISLNCDGHLQKVSAKIVFISPKAELTPPVLYSKEERSKFVYRVEAFSEAADKSCFHPGQLVTVFL